MKVIERVRSVWADTSGAIAVEFAFLAPILAIGFLSMVDLGLAGNERMRMDSALRAGAQAAFTDPGAEAVRDVISDVASNDFVVSPAGDNTVSSTELLVDVERFCACPENVSAAVDCATGSCASAASPYVFYSLVAEKDYDATILPQSSLRSSLMVQVE